MAKLKMVAGKTYVCPPVFGPETVVTRGEVVEVSQEHADLLLADFYYDALNNEHPYFKLVDEGAATAKVQKAVVVEEEPEEDSDSAAPAPAPKRQRAAK